MWLKIIGVAIALVGCMVIFDSRRIAKKSFPFGDENTTTLGLKIFGTLLAFAGGILCVI